MIKGWDKVALKDIAAIVSGGTPSTADQSYWGGDILWCTPTDITHNKSKYLSKTKRTITKQAVKHASGILPIGTILLCSRATIGEMSIAKRPITTNQGFKNIIANKGISNEFLYYVLKTKKSEMMAKAHGSTFFEISKKAIDEFTVEIPKEIIEQELIAKVLSDIDSLIENLEKLIAKKKLVKQGAMQQLLMDRNKTKKVLLADIVQIQKGELITQQNVLSGFIPVVAGGINPCYYHNKANRNGNVITVSASGANAGIVNFWEGPIYASDCSTIESNRLISIKYLYYQLKLNQENIFRLQTGGAQPHVQPNGLSKLLIDFHESLDEQRFIESVLTDMDNEIIALTKQLGKYRQIKQGMMEQLLTGKIRLVEGESEQSKQEDAKPKSSQQFEDAVWMAIIVAACTNPQYAFGRVKLQKILYLTKRLRHVDTASFGIHAAGPYDSASRYSGGEKIAKSKNYITEQKNLSGPGSKFYIGENILEAVNYFKEWGYAVFEEIIKNILVKLCVDELELYATVDKAAEDLKVAGKPVDLKTVKSFIEEHEIWRPKLDRNVFNDSNIEKAIAFSNAISMGGSK